VMFLLQNAAMEELTVSGVTLTPIEIDSGTAKFDLTLFVEETQEGLQATFEYNTGLFEAETISRMLVHFQTLLESIVADDRRRVTELPLLVESEQQQLLYDWNETDSEYVREQLLHEWFEEQVARTPGAIALEYEEEQLSYAELNERANQLAHYLQRLGVSREARVGVMLERRPAMLIGLLAALKAGCAYVPLDPQYPQERVRFMLADAEVQVLLTESGLRERVRESTVTVVYVDQEGEVIGTESRENPGVRVAAENLAYVIYTSGSTGIPKGVAITHGSATAFLHWSIEFFTVEKLQAVLASTSINFDLSVFELFAPLSVGGRVILAENALQLGTLPAGGRVELINTVPSAAAELVRQGAIPASVRVINLAGEALSRKLVQELYGLGTVAQVTNLYGPSEDTTYSTYEVVADGANEAVLIGRPIANTQVYLLDGEQQPVAIGVSGEIYLGGEGLARGYLKRAELTAERFVPNPYSREAGGRLYRTGDLGRYRNDGRIEYLGRADQQVKVRGFRIELGEIEARLEQQGGVRQCVVTASETSSGGDKQLVAYVVSEAGEGVTASELRAYLKERLPEYMIPSGWVFLAEMPLTTNGKVDRKRLPAAELGAGVSTEYQAPRTPTEEVVAGIWAEVLQVERVGVLDNFFELGGHSLLATNVIFAVKNAFQVELPLRSIFESPTVSDLSQRIEAARSNGAGTIKRLSRERYRVKTSVLTSEPASQVEA
jgi:amino acid adenylation domain-containing protein